MSKTLLILNDAPYGTERSYNGLRVAGALAKRPAEEVRVFLMGDGAGCAKRGQRTAKGYYNIEAMLKVVTLHDGDVGVCGSCMGARGLDPAELVEGCHQSSLEELTDWIQWAEKALVF